MGKPYSEDFRRLVIEDLQAGVSPSVVARRYRISRSSVYRLRDLHRETGSVAPRVGDVGRKPALRGYEDALRQIVASHPDATLEELQGKLPVSASISALWRTLHRLGFTLKKSHSRRGTETA